MENLQEVREKELEEKLERTEERLEKLKQKEKEKRLKLKEKAKEATKKFQKEFRKSVSESIIAAFGLLIALSWKELITELVNKISSATPVKGKLISTIIVTIICVLGILIVSRWAQKTDKKELEEK